MQITYCRMVLQALSMLPELAWNSFGVFRALSGAFEQFRASPETCLKVSESAQQCKRVHSAR
eukprot:5925962-Alexandrium_andersonii.AAC.1